MIKLYAGETSTALGSYNPSTNATVNLLGPHGKLTGLNVQQRFAVSGWSLTPEFSWTHLSEGRSIGWNRTTNTRVGLAVAKAWDE
jgi:hypothetical protein